MPELPSDLPSPERGSARPPHVIPTAAVTERIGKILTEEVRNDELDGKRREQPYRLYAGADGALRKLSPGVSPGDARLVFDVDENVFPPDFGITTGLITCAAIKWFGDRKRVVEMGAGSGYPGISLAAAGTGMEHLVLADILPEAVRCARKNVDQNRHALPPACRVDVVESDLFAGVDPAFRPDLILHNQTFYPDDGRFGLFADGGEQITVRFLEQARGRLAPGGSILMSFASFVDARHDPRLIAQRLGFAVKIVNAQDSRDGTVTGFTYEITPA